MKIGYSGNIEDEEAPYPRLKYEELCRILQHRGGKKKDNHVGHFCGFSFTGLYYKGLANVENKLTFPSLFYTFWSRENGE